MALCPYCFQKEKEFFAEKCNECNTPVSFGHQVTGSLWSTFVTAAFWFGVILLIAMAF